MARSDFCHIRRCHVCGATETLENQKVKTCKACGKALPPVLFYDEADFKGLSDTTGKIVYIESLESADINSILLKIKGARVLLRLTVPY